MRRRTNRMITCLYISDETTLKTYRQTWNFISALYAYAYTGMTTEEAMLKQVGQLVSRR